VIGGLSTKDALLCAGFSLALPLGQVLFKQAAILHGRSSGALLLRLIGNPALAAALAWYGATAFFWFYILTRVPLSTAYPFAVAGSGLVPLFAWLIFKEQLTWQFGLGYAVMIVGFLVAMQGKG
jgi:drug/metabolite transporter (DMT)-like permease